MTDSPDRPGRGDVIGGKHGSPTIMFALPFAKITNVDTDLRDVVADLAMLVARLAEHAAAGNATELDLVQRAAEDLAVQML